MSGLVPVPALTHAGNSMRLDIAASAKSSSRRRLTGNVAASAPEKPAAMAAVDAGRWTVGALETGAVAGMTDRPMLAPYPPAVMRLVEPPPPPAQGARSRGSSRGGNASDTASAQPDSSSAAPAPAPVSQAQRSLPPQPPVPSTWATKLLRAFVPAPLQAAPPPQVPPGPLTTSAAASSSRSVVDETDKQGASTDLSRVRSSGAPSPARPFSPALNPAAWQELLPLSLHAPPRHIFDLTHK
jgi:hypothetical protein